MKQKIILLSVALTASLYVSPQSARNPLNSEPATLVFRHGETLANMTGMTLHLADGQTFERTSFFYDEQGRKSGELTQRPATDGSWRNLSKDTLTYNTESVTAESFTWTDDTWQPVSKTVSFTDNSGRKLYALTYNYDKQSETYSANPLLRTEWKRDDMGHITEITKQYRTALTARISYSYSDDGNLTEEVYQTLNDSDGSWKNGGKYSYSSTTTATGTILKAVSHYATRNKWNSDGFIINEISPEGTLARSDYFAVGKDDKPVAYYVYTYSGNVGESTLSINSKTLNVYPNPASGSFTVSAPDELLGSDLVLYDVAGKQVKNIMLTSPETHVDASSLQAGVYVLKTGSSVRKIVIR
jgi:hypothetical protein